MYASYLHNPKRVVLSIALFAVVLALAAVPASAQAPQFVEYSAKFLCGVPTSAQLAAGGISAGTYTTSINIHNPHDHTFSSQSSTKFLKKAVLSLQEGITPQPPSPFVTDVLQDDFAEEVDCQIIRRLLGPTAPPAPTFIEGWVVIIVPPTNFTNVLDVVGIYTNSRGDLEIHDAKEHFFTPGGASSSAPPARKNENGQ
jgi:hypothetical protein